MPILLGSLAGTFFGLSLTGLSVFLILLVLVQRGKGGGLTGALGGPGGQSAFGTKAGDIFTRITAGTAVIWIFLCASAILAMGNRVEKVDPSDVPAAAESPSLGSLESVGNVDGSDDEDTDSSESSDSEPANDTDGESTAENFETPDSASSDEGSSEEGSSESSEGEGDSAESTPSEGEADPAESTSSEAETDPAGESDGGEDASPTEVTASEEAGDN